jgi:hypothetical protein
MTSAVPILVGVVGSPDDTVSDASALGQTFAAYVEDLRVRHPHSDIVVLTTLGSGPELAVIRALDREEITVLACVRAVNAAKQQAVFVSDRRSVDGDPRELVAYASDILVIVSNEAASPELLTFADRRRTGEPPPAGFRKLLAPADVGPYVLLEGSSLQPFFPPRFDTDVSAEVEFGASLRRRDQYNRDIRAVPVPIVGTHIQRLGERTDAVANVFQNYTHWGQHALYVLGFAAAVVQLFGQQVTLFSFDRYQIYVKLALLMLAFLVFWFVRTKDYQNRYQDYRAISEALRVQAVWTAIGIEESIEESYLPMQQTDLQWIRNALRTIHFLDWRSLGTSCDFAVVEFWVTDQHGYYVKSSKREASARKRIEISAGVFGAVVFKDLELPRRSGVLISEYAAFFTLFVAILMSYTRTRAHSENANRYQRMFFVFDRAKTLLERAKGQDERVQVIARELGREALGEHAEWLLSQRERPIALVETAAS